MPSGHVALGRVLKMHGLRGEMKVEPLTSQLEHFAAGRKVWIAGIERDIEASRQAKGSVYLRLDGVTTVEAAEALRDHIFSLPESELAPLPEGEYYAHDIVGLEVVDTEGALVGKVVDLLATGGNDVYLVKGPRGEVLLPAVDDVIIEVDVAGGRMVVSLMEGMLPDRRSR